MDTNNTVQLNHIAEMILKNFHGISTDLTRDGFNQKINNNSNLKLVTNGIQCPLLSFNHIGTFDHSGISPNVSVATEGLWFSCLLLVNNNDALTIIKSLMSNTVEKGGKDDSKPALSINLEVTTNAKNGTRIPAGTSEVFGVQDIYYKSFSLNGEIVTYLLFRHNKFTHKIKMEKGNQIIISMTNNVRKK